MICGKRLSRTLLVLSLLLLPLSPIFSDDEGFLITEAELSELETILNRQATTIEELQRRLSEQETRLQRLLRITERQVDLLSQQATTISELGNSFSEYETEVQQNQLRTIATSSGITLAIITAGIVIRGLL